MWIKNNLNLTQINDNVSSIYKHHNKNNWQIVIDAFSGKRDLLLFATEKERDDFFLEIEKILMNYDN